MTEVEKIYFLSRASVSLEKRKYYRDKLFDIIQKYPINILEIDTYLSEVTGKLWSFKQYENDAGRRRASGVLFSSLTTRKKFRVEIYDAGYGNVNIFKVNWASILLSDNPTCPRFFKKAIFIGLNRKIEQDRIKNQAESTDTKKDIGVKGVKIETKNDKNK